MIGFFEIVWPIKIFLGDQLAESGGDNDRVGTRGPKPMNSGQIDVRRPIHGDTLTMSWTEREPATCVSTGAARALCHRHGGCGRQRGRWRRPRLRPAGRLTGRARRSARKSDIKPTSSRSLRTFRADESTNAGARGGVEAKRGIAVGVG
jgi:hypothetical protein